MSGLKQWRARRETFSSGLPSAQGPKTPGARKKTYSHSLNTQCCRHVRWRRTVEEFDVSLAVYSIVRATEGLWDEA
jgi:hypothetical protein